MGRLYKLFWISIVVIIFIWAIFAFFGKFAFTPTVSYKISEPILNKENKNIDYWVDVVYSSEGAFVAGEPVEVEVSVRRAQGAKFIDVNTNCMIFDKNSYFIMNIGETKINPEGVVCLDYYVEEDKLYNKGDILYDVPGSFLAYGIMFSTDDSKIVEFESKKQVHISPHDVARQIENNNRIFSLTLIMIGLAIITFLTRKK